ncbi:hypothetical protein EUTSA_v10028146mg [Eutrema salsugineum]|uniref:DUF7722 domain-containing protein n=1 Tax=Eutrema salsugineum TaxID=72664 RepID=V4LSG9_EUTSA|nr:uncharacterized protein LOC18022910 [Eutrema salsugineum]ESQ46764.1 hypothetical protein EUTSA_v10028146mg [Eutrema salsugineum]
MGIQFSHDHSNSAIRDNNNHHQDCENQKNKTKIGDNTSQNGSSCFKIPLHYPKYTKSDYEKMPEWQLDQLLREYGLPIIGDSYEKRKFAIGAFLWPSEKEH